MNRTFKLFFFLLAVAVVVFLFTERAMATKPKQSDGQEQEQEQKQRQKQKQSQHAESHSLSESVAAANNQGNELSVNYEAGAPDVILVPNNNTENCLRVWGLSFSNSSGGGGLGIPYRSARCDYEQAADDAFAAGERELGWFWKCNNKSLYKRFRDKGEDRDTAINDCTAKMVGSVNDRRTIEALQARIELLQEQSKADRQLYNDSKSRIEAQCEESKDRIIESCYPK